MPIVDVTGFTADEVPQMKAIRHAVQTAFQKRWSFERLDTTTVNFLTDPSIETSPDIHAMARVYTMQFINMTEEQRDEVCWEVQRALEEHGGHTFNEAFPPGYKSICGGWKEGRRPD
ncbi:hypothetical protein KC865_01385 [Candidatus Kaiserbacteria bacterium]|nr:hypothetical protein [Candidatus Kaiserbacteria bacterium]USN92642.1 MAG: hypothetical protein H6782_02410 [Candidatus Nomurabacteria bacterium]